MTVCLHRHCPGVRRASGKQAAGGLKQGTRTTAAFQEGALSERSDHWRNASGRGRAAVRILSVATLSRDRGGRASAPVASGQPCLPSLRCATWKNESLPIQCQSHQFWRSVCRRRDEPAKRRGPDAARPEIGIDATSRGSTDARLSSASSSHPSPPGPSFASHSRRPSRTASRACPSTPSAHGFSPPCTRG